MPETPHIKRFEEHWQHWHEPGRMQGLLFDAGLNAIQAAHDDLAEHVERLEARLSTVEYNLNMAPPDPTKDGNHTL